MKKNIFVLFLAILVADQAVALTPLQVNNEKILDYPKQMWWQSSTDMNQPQYDGQTLRLAYKDSSGSQALILILEPPKNAPKDENGNLIRVERKIVLNARSLSDEGDPIKGPKIQLIIKQSGKDWASRNEIVAKKFLSKDGSDELTFDRDPLKTYAIMIKPVEGTKTGVIEIGKLSME